MRRTLGIFKFGRAEHMESLLNGDVYMKTLEHFAKLECDPLRADRKEGDARWLQSANVVLSIRAKDGDFTPIKGLIGPIRYSHPDDRKKNIYCMYGVGEEVESEGIDPRVLTFGDTFVAITDPEEFLPRVKKAAAEIEQEIIDDRVSYVREFVHQGPVGPFRKTSDFEYQSEYRIVMQPGLGQITTLKVGDLRDIAISGSSADLQQRMYFNLR